jgi:ABC-type lipoprotein release transport system permease subunit
MSEIRQAVRTLINPVDLATYITVVGILAVMTLLASLVPAYRAAHIDPLNAVRQE